MPDSMRQVEWDRTPIIFIVLLIAAACTGVIGYWPNGTKNGSSLDPSVSIMRPAIKKMVSQKEEVRIRYDSMLRSYHLDPKNFPMVCFKERKIHN